MPVQFILASESPRRQQLLRDTGYIFDVIPGDIDERFCSGESPQEHASRLAKEKAKAVSGQRRDVFVLAADTIVLIDGRILGKPSTEEEAREMLRALSGRKHTVITAYVLINDTRNIFITDTVESAVVFKEMPEDEIEWYIKTKEPYDKAGGYAVQGKAAFFIKEIYGSYTNVIGLPLCEIVAVLKAVGITAWEKGENHGTYQ